MQNLQEEIQFAIDTAMRGGEEIRKNVNYIRATEEVVRRWPTERFTEVKTMLDKTVDDMLRQQTQRRFPNDAIYSEENRFLEGNSGRTWVDDSIDGTLNLQGPLLGTFAVCRALVVNKVPILGVMFSPNLRTSRGGRLWVGETGRPTLYSPEYPNEELVEVHASDCDIRNHAIGGFDSGKHDRTVVYPYLQKLDHDKDGVTCLYRIASASMSLGAVVNGDWDFYGATSLEPEDMAAAVPILQGAGATVTTIDGRPWTIAEPSILAANPVLHADLLQYLNS